MSQELACVFPGQGSQKPGMLGELADNHAVIRNTFDQASEVLGYDLWDLVQHDDGTELSKTHITQPAILTSSVAVWRLWREQGGALPSIMAGHSLGEYSALVCSGVIAFNDAVHLVRKRGEFMQNAVPAGVGSMAAIVGLEDDQVVEACALAAEDEVVQAVNFNSPGQVVIAGHVNAVNRAIDHCKQAGAKRALPLPVSAPFHSALMKPAAEAFQPELDKVTLNAPEIPVLQNYSLDMPHDPEVIRGNLIAQIHNPVPWVETIELFAARGVKRIYEIGPGKVLCGLIKRINSQLEAQAVNDEASLQAGLAGHE